jgi:hypothetical protein
LLWDLLRYCFRLQHWTAQAEISACPTPGFPVGKPAV